MAGDPERINMAQVDADGGIRYHNNHIKSLVSILPFLFIRHAILIILNSFPSLIESDFQLQAEFARAHQIEELKHL